MRSYLFTIVCFFSSILASARSIPQVLKNLNKQSVPYIKVDELKAKLSLFILMHAN
jgi:hypothetical protein